MTSAAVKTLNRQLVRRASRAVLGGFRPPDDPLASWLGKVHLAVGEDWPTSAGRPMMPLCQFNMADVPFCPETLSNVAF